MKRYRLTNFYINATQTSLRDPAFQGVAREREILQLKELLATMRGPMDINEKFDRWLEMDLYTQRSRVEFEDFIEQVADAYVSKLDYPALTGACCIGERILNILMLKLRDHYKGDEDYKRIYGKGSFINWEVPMKYLERWGVLNSDMLEAFDDLEEIRNRRVHYEPIHDARADALSAIKHALWLTHAIFGNRTDLMFTTTGEMYIKKAVEASPFVKEFFLPSCVLVGYKHLTSADGIHDNESYESREVTDEEFSTLRTAWRSTPLPAAT